MAKELRSPPGYATLLTDIKERVHAAQVRDALAVNRELVLLYWSIGRDILERQLTEGWGTKVIERLAKDLGTEFPGCFCARVAMNPWWLSTPSEMG